MQKKNKLSVVWLPYNNMGELSSLLYYTKEGLFEKTTTKNTLEITKRTSLVAGLLDNGKLGLWAKPGVSKEDYICLIEQVITNSSYLSLSCCEIVTIARKCMQHALSLYNIHVEASLDTYIFDVPTFFDCYMDEN